MVGDAYSAQALEATPFKDVHLLISRLKSLIPGGDNPVDIPKTSAWPALQVVLDENRALKPQKEVEETAIFTSKKLNIEVISQVG